MNPTRYGHDRRLSVAASLVLMLGGLAGIAQAVEFDEKVKAPTMKDAGSLRTQSQAYSTRFTTLQSAAPEQAIDSVPLALERFDLTWQIEQAIDMRRPLGDLTAVGFVDRGDGSYFIDLQQFPQWHRLDRSIAESLPQYDWDLYSRELIQRGMTKTDAAMLGNYIASHKVRAAVGEKTLSISLGFSRLVKKFDALKRPVPDAMVLSYLYQRERAAAGAFREWTTGLLKSVDAQSARILLSMVAEGHATSIWAPSDQSAGIADVLATVRLPNFDQLAIASAKGEAP